MRWGIEGVINYPSFGRSVLGCANRENMQFFVASISTYFGDFDGFRNMSLKFHHHRLFLVDMFTRICRNGDNSQKIFDGSKCVLQTFSEYLKNICQILQKVDRK